MAYARAALLVLALAIGAAARGAADTLILHDGRVLEDVTVEVSDEGVTVVFANARIDLPKQSVHAHFEADDPAGAETVRSIRSHARWRNRHRLPGSYWTYETTLPPFVLARYQDAMEEHLRFVQGALGVEDASAPLPTVCIYANREEFEQIGGVGFGVEAYLLHRDPPELSLYDDPARHTLSVRMARWVTAAYVVRRAYPDLKRKSFLQQGVVDYYGSAIETPEKPGSVTGLVPGAHAERLHQSRTIRSRVDLARVTGERDVTQQAWAWALVHFLLESKEHAETFRRFLRSARGKDDEVDLNALTKALGIEDPDAHHAFLADWTAHLDRLAPTTAADSLAAADVARQSGTRIRSQRLYRKALALPGGKEAGWRGLAALARARGDKVEKKALDAVLTENPFDVGIRRRRARWLLEVGSAVEAARETALAEEIHQALGGDAPGE